MAESIVIDTGPLITLDRIGALDIPGKFPLDFLCPAEVRRELDEGRRAALAAGLKVTGVLGLLGLAKQKQVIQAVKPYIQKAVAAWDSV